MKKWPLISLTGTIKVVGLVVKQCVPCLVAPILMLIGCNQETIVQGEGLASLMVSTSNRPDSIVALNEASVGMSPHWRVHPMGVMTTSYLTDFQMDGILRGLKVLLPHCLLSLWSLQGEVIANELGQYHLEVSLALTQEEGNQMLGELVGRDRVESPEVFWDGSTELGPEYDDNAEV